MKLIIKNRGTFLLLFVTYSNRLSLLREEVFEYYNLKITQEYFLLHILLPHQLNLIILFEIYVFFITKVRLLLLFVMYSNMLTLLREQVFEAYN